MNMGNGIINKNNLQDIPEWNERCYECGGYGDDYAEDENGDLHCLCNECWNNPHVFENDE